MHTMKILAWPRGSIEDLNPYARLIYSKFSSPAITLEDFNPLIFQKNVPDVFHIHWPEAIFWVPRRRFSFFAALNVIFTALRVRINGGLVALTLHNMEPHDKLSAINRIIWKLYKTTLVAETNLLISLSKDALEQYKKKNPSTKNIKNIIIEHPHYRTCYPPPKPQAASRLIFNLPENKKIIGMIGSMRPSKKTPEAIAAFLATANSDELLFIVGGCNEDHWRDIEAAKKGDARVVVIRKSLSNEMLVDAVAACDLILLNQAKMLNSGTALLSLSFNRPLIAAKAGSLVELQRSVGHDWVELYDAPLDGEKLRNSLNSIYTKNNLSSEAPLSEFEPDKISKNLLASFKLDQK